MLEQVRMSYGLLLTFSILSLPSAQAQVQGFPHPLPQLLG